MKPFRDLSLRAKLALSAALASGAALLLVGAAVLVLDSITLRASLVRRTGVQADIVGANCLSALQFSDPESARATLAALRADPLLVAAALYTDDHRLFAEYHRVERSRQDPLPAEISEKAGGHRLAGNRLLLFRPVRFNEALLGTVLLVADTSEISATLARDVVVFACVLAVSLLLALKVSSIMQRRISGPILKLVATARAVTVDKNYGVRIIPESGDEIGVLVTAFNEMLDEMQKRQDDLRQAHDKLEQRVTERTAQLEEANHELEAFTYSVSHDLRAPLRHIAGFAEMLDASGGEAAGNGNRYARKIARAAARMGDLIDDLLVFSRMGRAELQATQVNLASMVEDVVRECGQDTGSRAIDWRIGRLPVVRADPAMLRLALVNLIANAVKYTGKRDQARIEIGADRDTDYEVVVCVRDNGVGFEMKYVGKLFGVFQRLHRSDEFEGTGIGLANVRRIIHRHGGRTWAEGAPGEGAAFYFSLPKQQEATS